MYQNILARLVVITSGLMIFVSPINAEPNQASPVLTLDQVIVRVLENNPEFTGSNHEYRA